MKKRGLLLMILFGAALMIGCGANTAELAFKNVDGSAVTDIVWESENKMWSGPYITNQTSESKEVSELNSSVVGNWGGGPIAAYFPETNSNSLSLNPGESYVYSIRQP